MEFLFKLAGVGLGVAGGIASAITLGVTGAPAIAVVSALALVPAATYAGGWLVVAGCQAIADITSMESAAIVLIVPAAIGAPIAAVGAGLGTHTGIDYLVKHPHAIEEKLGINLGALSFNKEGGVVVPVETKKLAAPHLNTTQQPA